MRKEHNNIATNIDSYQTNIMENTAMLGANANTFPLIQLKIEMVSDHSPVDDAMPEILPQARLTRTVESSGLKSK